MSDDAPSGSGAQTSAPAPDEQANEHVISTAETPFVDLTADDDLLDMAADPENDIEVTEATEPPRTATQTPEDVDDYLSMMPNPWSSETFHFRF